ncbi:MAG TPA: substrate-binding and VWA domain-containing protein [Actinomycetota bacterium]|nr:substrate-binding and VWA domain-containing protein [Actinomycetota bacterium]
MDDRARRALSQIVAVVAGILLILFLRGSFGSDGGDPQPGDTNSPRAGCMGLSVIGSSEKAALLGQMATSFEQTNPTVDGTCIDVIVNSKASGGAMEALARGWDEKIDGPRPDVWSPASSGWVVLLRQRLAARDAPNIVPDETPSIAQTPLVIAMPRPMAESLGWPDKQLGWSDVFALAQDPQGWGSVGHPEWGAFRLGKTNPNFSTSGLNALVGEYFAATGLSSDLSLSRIEDPNTVAFVEGVESSVVHYGDTTLTFLSNLQRADDRGEGLTYISAVTVEEKSVWDYNLGNPTGDPATLGDHAKPSVPLVAIYPKEGTLLSDNPWVALDAQWMTEAKRTAAQQFLTFVRTPEQQQRFQRFAFRTAQGAPGDNISPANGLLPGQPTLTLTPPSPEVLDRIQSGWEDVRKSARVLLVIDISGSMGEASGTGQSKLELAKEAAIASLDLFAPDDDVGLWVFTSEVTEGNDYLELIPIGPLGPNIDRFKREIRSLVPLNGTPLYTTIEAAVQAMRLSFDPTRINGVVVLTDGKNEDPRNNDLQAVLDDLDSELNIRVFPIAYGSDADLATLTKIANASRAAVYDATDPAAIAKVFVSVISNF